MNRKRHSRLVYTAHGETTRIGPLAELIANNEETADELEKWASAGADRPLLLGGGADAAVYVARVDVVEKPAAAILACAAACEALASGQQIADMPEKLRAIAAELRDIADSMP